MFINRFFGIQYPNYDVDDVIDPVVTDDVVPEEKKTDLDILNEDDEKDDDQDDTTGDDDKDEDEEEDEKDKEDEIDEDEIVRLNWSKLREKYPELAKDPEFKVLKNTIYREQEYTKIFPNPKDAEEALSAQANYDDLRSLVLSGDTEQLIKNIGEVSEKALDKFATSFLPSLRTTDSKLYTKITTPLIRNILRSVASYGEKHDHKETGENIIKAARVVNKAIFDDYELGKVEDEPKSKEKDDDLEEDKKNYFQQKHKDLLDSLSSDVDSSLNDLIGDVDPGNLLKDRPRLKAKLLAEIKDEIRKELSNDKAHLTRMDGLWARERRNGYSGTLKDSLKTTFMSRAKVLMPEIRKKIRKEYLGNVKDSDLRDGDKLKNRDKNLPVGRNVTSSGKKVPTAKEAKEKGMTARQLLDME